MRLLNVHTVEFAEYHTVSERPKYAIASHRWINGFEAKYQDVQAKTNIEGLGHRKVVAFVEYVKKNIPSIDWLWIDTCCINKDSAAELSEAINLMFEWYRDAEVCLAYLPDVESVEDRAAFRRSEWFQRGWTLQELVAPRVVIFLTKSWDIIGNKGASVHPYSESNVGHSLSAGRDLEQEIAEVTRVPVEVLLDFESSAKLSTSEKLSWMEGRTTTREEDMSYALYGIFDVSLGANYGERHKARERLLAAIRQGDLLAAERVKQYEEISRWLSAPDPWQNHRAARKQHEPETGAWLLDSKAYEAWKFGSSNRRHLWIHGQAGSGKTILCSTAVEDIKAHCTGLTNAAQVVFYFSFSDSSKQTYEDLIKSMVEQLGRQEPGLSLLRRAWESCDRSRNGLDDLQKILSICAASYDVIYLHLDALDECLLTTDTRLDILAAIEDLLQEPWNIRMLATSRDLPEIRNCMNRVAAETRRLGVHQVDTDIGKYISTQLSRDSKLSRLNDTMKTLIRDTFLQKANGMFRWVYCQMQELKKSKSTTPKFIKAALQSLPDDLDETYNRMLCNITDEDRPDALKLLYWISYAESPRSLLELVDVRTIDAPDDPSAKGVVDVDNRGTWSDILAILGGLVVIDGHHDILLYDDPIPKDLDLEGFMRTPPANDSFPVSQTVRLAHFSVKEYLESDRLLLARSEVSFFHLNPVAAHKILAQSCLVYLEHHCSMGFAYLPAQALDERREETKRHLLRIFRHFYKLCWQDRLFEYAANSWPHHSALQQTEDYPRELALLTSEPMLRAWIAASWMNYGIQECPMTLSPALYYASAIGHLPLVTLLIEEGARVDADEGKLDIPLLAAIRNGHLEIVKVLLRNNASPTKRGDRDIDPLQAASLTNNSKIVKVLLEFGAEVNAHPSEHGTALQIASYRGYLEIVCLLLANGADINASGVLYWPVIRAALAQPREN